MNDSASQQQQGGQPLSDFDFGDYIANPTGNDTHHHHQHDLDIYPEFPQQRNHSQMNLDSNLVSQNLLGPHNRMDHLPQVQSQNISAEMLNLKGRLEQQMKLQQLQQLILQQQVRNISIYTGLPIQHWPRSSLSAVTRRSMLNKRKFSSTDYSPQVLQPSYLRLFPKISSLP